jgi:hypothetical protein
VLAAAADKKPFFIRLIPPEEKLLFNRSWLILPFYNPFSSSVMIRPEKAPSVSGDKADARKFHSGQKTSVAGLTELNHCGKNCLKTNTTYIYAKPVPVK